MAPRRSPYRFVLLFPALSGSSLRWKPYVCNLFFCLDKSQACCYQKYTCLNTVDLTLHEKTATLLSVWPAICLIWLPVYVRVSTKPGGSPPGLECRRHTSDLTRIQASCTYKYARASDPRENLRDFSQQPTLWKQQES